MVEKTIQIKKRGGGTRSQRVKVLASGKYKFIKNKTRSRTKRKPKRRGNPKRRANKRGNPKRRRIRTVPRNKKRKGSNNHITATAMKFIRIGALIAPAAAAAQMSDPVGHAIMFYTGYNIRNGEWHFDDMKKGWAPYVMSVLATKGVQKLSGIINRI